MAEDSLTCQSRRKPWINSQHVKVEAVGASWIWCEAVRMRRKRLSKIKSRSLIILIWGQMPLKTMNSSIGKVIVLERRGILLWWFWLWDYDRKALIERKFPRSQATRNPVTRRRAVIAVIKARALRVYSASLSSARIRNGTLSCWTRSSFRFSTKVDTQIKVTRKVASREARGQGVERVHTMSINKTRILGLIILWWMQLVLSPVPEMTALPGRRATG